uniref:Uncharacterized protein n=1 Tax=Percolomonas cosmopolitus TaxID=63605 RepID=A0A7S1PJ34_9EUKA
MLSAHQNRSYASIDKMMQLKRFRGNIHKRKAVENFLRYRKQTEGMVSQQIKEIKDRNKQLALPQWKAETPFGEAYHKYIYELHFIHKKPFKDTRLVEMLDMIQSADDLTRLMQLWRLCLQRPVRFTQQFSDALLNKLLEYGEVDAAGTIVANGRLIFMPIGRALTQNVVSRLAQEQKYDLIVKIFRGASQGLLTFSPQKHDYLFFIQQLKGQEAALEVFFSHSGDTQFANQLLPEGHEPETYSLMLETCKENNATRIAEHIYHEMLYNCKGNKDLLEQGKAIVMKLREEHPVAEEETEGEEAQEA